MAINVQFLGTGGSVPTEKRSLPSVYLEYSGVRMLFDCGEGSQRQMRIAKIPFMKLDMIFISHLHADHLLGIGGLLQTMDLFKRVKKLQIFGPVGIEEVIKKVITTGHFVLEGFDLEINEIQAKDITTVYSTKNFAIDAVKLDHAVPCLGFSFYEKEKRKFLKKKALDLRVPEGPMFNKLQHGESVKVGKKTIKPDDVLGKGVKGKKVTYIPDTRPCESTVKLAKDSDILIHEATYMHDLYENALDGKHSTAKEAAEIAKRSNAGELYIFHISQRYSSVDGLLKEAKRVFPKTRIPNDFDVVKI